MELIITSDEQELAACATKKVCDYINHNPGKVLVFPTGTTPLRMYAELAKSHRTGLVSFSNSYLVELDDYYGIPLDDRRNLFAWLDKVFIQKVDFQPDRILRFNTQASDPIAESDRVQYTLAHWGGIGLAVLGLGPNGHLGFNEPGSYFTSPARVVDLTPASVESNARYWGNTRDVPAQGYTLGLGVLRQANTVVLLVSGVKKAKILQQALEGPVTPNLPASCLQNLTNVIVIADKSAAQGISQFSKPYQPS